MARKILDVPFIEQKPSFCGPAVLAMVLQYHGEDVSQDDIGYPLGAEYFAVKVSELGGAAKERGFNTSVKHNDLSEIIESIDDDRPVIVCQKLRAQEEYGHYRAIVGYDSDCDSIIFHDPDIEGNMEVSQKLFSFMWLAGDNQKDTLYISKK